MRILFVTWDGPGTDYLSGLFLPIYNRVQRATGHEFHLLQFTWDSAERTQKVAETARAMGIAYTAIEAWRNPLYAGTAATIGRGALEVARYARAHGIDALMPRSVIPAAMCLGALARTDARLIYDADGLAEEERADFGRMRHGGLQYRLVRAVGERAVARSAAVVTRTDWARDDLARRAGVSPERIFVVANGRDSERYVPGSARVRAEARASLGIPADAPLVAYVGSMGDKYRPDLVAGFLRHALRRLPDLHAVALTPQTDVLQEAVGEGDSPRLHITTVALEEVPAIVASADLGLAFIADRRATRAVSLVKIGEYLLCGTPVAATHAALVGSGPLGDAGFLLDGDPDGLSQEYDRLLAWLTDTIRPHREAMREASREVGLARFTLARSAQQYAEALEYAESGSA